jgi:hypothetical protein
MRLAKRSPMTATTAREAAAVVGNEIVETETETETDPKIEIEMTVETEMVGAGAVAIVEVEAEVGTEMVVETRKTFSKKF